MESNSRPNPAVCAYLSIFLVCELAIQKNVQNNKTGCHQTFKKIFISSTSAPI